MKKMLFRISALLLSAALLLSLSACGGETKPKEIIPIPDADVDLRETDELVIYVPEGGSEEIGWFAPFRDNLIKEYMDFYADIDLKIQSVPADEYGTIVATEIMAGGGPDLIFPDQMRDSDFYKIMDTGAFLNLEKIIEQDERFRYEDYVDGIMEGARYKGGQYLMPLAFTTSYLTGSQEALDQVGFSRESLEDCFSFLKEAERITQERKSAEYGAFLGQFAWTDQKEYRVPLWSVDAPPITTRMMEIDLPLVDYERKEILREEEQIRKWAETTKQYQDVLSLSFRDTSGLFVGISRGNFSLGYESWSIYYYIFDTLFGAKGQGQTPFIEPMPGETGEKVSRISRSLAINANSKNQKNAWNLIKLMLGLSFQGGISATDTLGGFPVLKAAYTDEISYMQTEMKNEWTELEDFTEESGVKYAQLSDEEYDAIVQELMNPGKVLLPESEPVQTMFEEALLPYFDGEAELDQCMSQLRSKLEIYVSE